MAHEALARKYRPQTFEQMVGQQAVVQTLKNALSTGKIHPAYIFSGIRGIGKTTAARLFAKGLNCVKGPTAEPCNECPSCTEIRAARSMDVLEIDGATNTKAEEARDLMQAARYTPARDRFRVFIIDEVHMLSTAAFNALLKTLEEPPAHAVFLLATTEPHKIPETIHSRAQHFQFRRVSPQQVAQFLAEVCGKEELQVEPGALDLVARAGEGSVRDSLTLLDRLNAYAGGPLTEEAAVEVLGVVGHERLLDLVEILAEGRVDAVPPFVDALVERGQNVERFLVDLARLLQEMVRVRAGLSKGAPAPSDRATALAARFSLEDLLRLWELVGVAQQRLKGSPDPEAMLELQLTKAALLPRILPLDQVLAGLGQAPAAEDPVAARPAPPAQRPQPVPPTEPTEPEAPASEPTEGLRFKALIPFQRMDEAEASSYHSQDPRVARFRAEASRRIPMVAHTLEETEFSLDPEGVLHLRPRASSATGAALLSKPDRKAILEAVAREVGYPGPVSIETPQADSEAPERGGGSPSRPKEDDTAVKNVLRVLGGQVIKVTPVTLPDPAGGEHGEPE